MSPEAKPPFVKIEKGPFEHDPDSVLADTPKEAAQIYRNMQAQKEPLSDDVQDLLKKYPYLGDVIKDTTLTPFQKKLKMMPVYRDLRESRVQIDKDRRKLDEKIAFAKVVEPAIGEYDKWKNATPKLEKNDCSRLHQLVSFLKWQHRIMPEAVKGESPYTFPWHEVTPFVVEHDWSAAFKNATDYHDGAFNLPYEKCAFEFRISGRAVTVLAGQTSDEHAPTYTFYVGFKDFWVCNGSDEKPDWPPAFQFALGQIKAICVALDAEVATRAVVRSSESVNKRRVAEGREPFYSYHVVSLNRRIRIANPSSGSGMVQGKKRLHFRRGHWRHYAAFKTWVRWTLVGNPDLGFIDKEYRI